MSEKQFTLTLADGLHEDAPATTDLSRSPMQYYVLAATSDNTRKTYRSAIRQFEKWGGRLPTDTNSSSQCLQTYNPRAD